MDVDDPLSLRLEILELRLMLTIERCERRFVMWTSVATLVAVALAFAAGRFV